jgi:hypothetical protein
VLVPRPWHGSTKWHGTAKHEHDIVPCRIVLVPCRAGTARLAMYTGGDRSTMHAAQLASYSDDSASAATARPRRCSPVARRRAHLYFVDDDHRSTPGPRASTCAALVVDDRATVPCCMLRVPPPAEHTTQPTKLFVCFLRSSLLSLCVVSPGSFGRSCELGTDFALR